MGPWMSVVLLVVAPLTPASEGGAVLPLSIPRADVRPWDATWPCFLSVHPELEPVVKRLWAGSATFRRQCVRLADAGVPMRIRPWRDAGASRAKTTITLNRGVIVVADISVAERRDAPALVAHELEHVIEMVERVEYAGSPGAWRRWTGAYETARAQAVERSVAAELSTGPSHKKRPN